MTATGNYIQDSDVNNWLAGYTETQKQEVIDRVEELVEQLTKDYFYPKSFDVRIDGNGKSRLFLGLKPNILSISSIKVSGIALASSWWTHDKDSVYLDPEVSSDGLTGREYAELRYRLGERVVLFPRGRGNIHVVGTCGWPEKLDINNVSGTFVVGEIITGGTSKATATIKEVHSTYLKIIGRSTTNFQNDEEITGGTSEATADINNTAGAVNHPPLAIKQTCIILCRYENDPTLYTKYYKGSEKLGDFSYATSEEPLAGIREADVLLRSFVRRKPMIGVV